MKHTPTIHSIIILTIILGCLSFVTLPHPTLAQNNDLGDKLFTILEQAGGSQGAGFDTPGRGQENLPYIIGGIIRILLSFLGIIFMVLILFGGFKWMTAGGNKEQVGDAIALIKNASIGLAIVIIAYAIASFIINAVIQAGGGVSGGGMG